MAWRVGGTTPETHRPGHHRPGLLTVPQHRSFSACTRHGSHRQNRPECRQHALKPLPGTARARVPPSEFFEEILEHGLAGRDGAMHAPFTPFDPGLGWEAPAALAHDLGGFFIETTARYRVSCDTSLSLRLTRPSRREQGTDCRLFRGSRSPGVNRRVGTTEHRSTAYRAVPRTSVRAGGHSDCGSRRYERSCTMNHVQARRVVVRPIHTVQRFRARRRPGRALRRHRGCSRPARSSAGTRSSVRSGWAAWVLCTRRSRTARSAPLH